jgi:23S rRNA (cytidine1920-2'-O)/16S rRNA (cytidine1409-2'-O)-methyltransferase
VIKKERLDILLVEKGFFTSREKAKAAIMAGLVTVDGEKIEKSGTKINCEACIKVKRNKLKYVSRGGLKLEKAIKLFGLDFQNKIVLDIGASTGGFTDCSLQNGASKVYAVDVGYGQLDWKLRQDNRIIVLERVNARYLTQSHIPENVDIITIDASFISLAKILPAVKRFIKETGFIVTLIKPQFEAGKEKVGKKGVVRDSLTHENVINKLIDAARELGLYCYELTYSPITGPEGNIEYLMLLKCFPPESKAAVNTKEVVLQAFNNFTKQV